jgi:hypothetical protein
MYERELRQQVEDPEVLVTLEPEEIATILLPILRKEATQYNGKISVYNFCNGFNQMQEIYRRRYVPAVTKLIMEAWNWMMPTDYSHQRQTITVATGCS